MVLVKATDPYSQFSILLARNLNSRLVGVRSGRVSRGGGRRAEGDHVVTGVPSRSMSAERRVRADRGVSANRGLRAVASLGVARYRVSSRRVASRGVGATVVDNWSDVVTNNRSSASHGVSSDRLLPVVPRPHVLSHGSVSVLPSLRVLLERSSTGEVVALSVLLLPLGKSAHVPLGRFARGPKIRDEGEEVEDEDQSDGPLESGADGGDGVTLRGRVASTGIGITTADGIGRSEANSTGDGEADNDELVDRVPPQ